MRRSLVVATIRVNVGPTTHAVPQRRGASRSALGRCRRSPVPLRSLSRAGRALQRLRPRTTLLWPDLLRGCAPRASTGSRPTVSMQQHRPRQSCRARSAMAAAPEGATAIAGRHHRCPRHSRDASRFVGSPPRGSRTTTQHRTGTCTINRRKFSAAVAMPRLRQAPATVGAAKLPSPAPRFPQQALGKGRAVASPGATRRQRGSSSSRPSPYRVLTSGRSGARPPPKPPPHRRISADPDRRQQLVGCQGTDVSENRKQVVGKELRTISFWFAESPLVAHKQSGKISERPKFFLMPSNLGHRN